MSAIPFAEVIGDPIAHSKSPLIHGFWLERLGLAGVYRATHVLPEDLGTYIAARRGDPAWRGCNVTLPHKQAVMPYLDRVDETAAAIGAVNTVVRAGDELVGYNSDAPGFLEPLRPILARQHLFRLARIIGSGGAARAVAHALWGVGFTLVAIARDPAKAEALVAPFDPGHVHVGDLMELARPTGFAFDDRAGILDLVVNATSLGMVGKAPLEIDWSHVPPGAVIYDLVYAPLDTPLLVEARARGHRAIDGLDMLIGQAAVAFEKFYGVRAPRDQDAALRALLVA
ncbi:MAG: shikimate 5-dehydrogenase [Sphingomonas bacterium]|nr:shikimate dehydrogenase [Sphingomonas bacterium]MDB5689480.1 shikimate 5-dehydrogenase [Sphingomonas bacterium]